MIKEVLLNLLETIKKSIESGECNPSEEEMLEIVSYLREFNTPFMSKEQSCNYLNISRAKFDNLIKEGKLPKGKKKLGFTELFWYKTELDKAVSNLKNKEKQRKE